jgi:hypothetical protein
MKQKEIPMNAQATAAESVFAGKQPQKARVARGPTIARFLLGIVYLVFGANYFLHFIPAGPPPERALGFIMGLVGSGYFLPLLKVTEIAAALLLLSNRFVPLALTVLAPIAVNIAAFHAFLEPAGLPLGFIVVALELYLAWVYRDVFRPMLASRVSPQSFRSASTSREIESTFA